MLRLHLGCNDDLRPGYVNVDLTRPSNADSSFVLVDLSGQVFSCESIYAGIDQGFMRFIPGVTFKAHEPAPWPWADSSVDEIVAHDVFEHIHNEKFSGNAGMIWTFNESWRVLKPGGILDLVVPCLPGSTPYVDPTHKVIYHSDNRYYFEEFWNHPMGERGRLGPGMGIIARFRTVGGVSFQPRPDGDPRWVPVQYALDDPQRHKLFLKLQAVK